MQGNSVDTFEKFLECNNPQDKEDFYVEEKDQSLKLILEK